MKGSEEERPVLANWTGVSGGVGSLGKNTNSLLKRIAALVELLD